MMRWWGPAHFHYAMTDAQSLTLSLTATALLIGTAFLTAKAVKKRKLRLGTSHFKSL